MRDGAELLIDEPIARRGRRMLGALADTLPANAQVTSHYTGTRRLLVLYGVGLAKRYEYRRRHLEAGGHVAMWDLGYWDREDAMRVSIDSLHPTDWQLAQAPKESRPHPRALRQDADPHGPILLVGLGRKSAHLYGLAPFEWERRKLGELRERFPDTKIWWRPKGRPFEPLAGTIPRHGMAIEDALRGSSLVVCRHSNVAIDAIVAGVPVECEEGAARAVSESPSTTERLEFLRRLSWFNWRPNEARGAWEWMQSLTRPA